MLKPEIIKAAKAANTKWGVPASISLAQFGQESGWGKDMPPGSCNPFGIKARNGQPFVACPTKEFVHGRYVTVDAKFCKFDSFDEAFDAHAKLLATSPIYRLAMASDTVEGFANALTGVYATDPHYGSNLIRLMDADNLYQYDEVTNG